MNGNDYLEVEEERYDEILEDYIEDLRVGNQEVPDNYKNSWIDLYLEGDY